MMTIFLSLGILLIVLSAMGLLKMKDLLLRLQVASKASTLGLIFCLFACIAAEPRAEVLTKALLTALFLFLTAPIAAQAMAIVGHRKARKSMRLPLDELSKDLEKSK